MMTDDEKELSWPSWRAEISLARWRSSMAKTLTDAVISRGCPAGGLIARQLPPLHTDNRWCPGNVERYLFAPAHDRTKMLQQRCRASQ